MSTVTLRWIGDLDQDKREQAGCVSSSSDQYRPRKIELKQGQKEIKIGRTNSKTPPDYEIESCINGRMISRNHATIERSAKGGSILYDHSMNGTYVNYTRVIGGVTLKHGDIVCFGHLNGANLKPGEKVSLFYSDLKYKVELSDAPISKEPASTDNSTKKRKQPTHIGSTVSSTQRSDADNDDDDSGDDEPSKPHRTASNALHGLKSHKSFKKPGSSVKRKHEDNGDDDDDDDPDELDDDEGDVSGSKRSLSSKGQKKRQLVDNNKKSLHSTSSSRNKPPMKSSHGKEKRRSGKSGKAGSLDGDEDGDGGDMFHYDTEECSARPCKQPQDIAIDWIQCDKCTLWYHQVCVGLKPSDANVDTYYCPYCKK